MNQIIFKKFDKNIINNLPIEQFEGKIVVVASMIELKKAVDFLKKQPILGIDTETKPSFKKGQIHKVAILQIATEEIAFIIQLKFTKLADEIIDILQDYNIIKVGLSLKDDIHQLSLRRKFKPEHFVELQNLVHGIGIEDMSLQKIYANLFQKKISKSKQLSNWNADILDEGQKKYAALDAVACLRIYNKINELKNNNNFEIVNDEK
jgi:ribonuclease D